MRVSVMSVNGVLSVEVSLDKGLATVKLKPGNTVTLKQLQEAIAKNGFTMKQSRVTAAGKLVLDGSTKFQISGSNDVLNLVPESSSFPAPSAKNPATLILEGTILEGTILEAAKGKTPDTVRYRSLSEEK